MNSKIGPTPSNAPDVGTHLKDKSLDEESQGKHKGKPERQKGQKRQNLERFAIACTVGADQCVCHGLGLHATAGADTLVCLCADSQTAPGFSLSSPQRRGGRSGNTGREKKRSLYSSLLACGVLLVSAVSANRTLAYETRRILKAIVSLSLLLSCLNAPSMAQAGAQAGPTQPGEVYAGIEITTEWVRAIALRFSRSEDESGLKLLYSENIRLALARDGDGQITTQAAKEAAQTVLKLLTRLRQQSQAPPERVFLIGSSGLGADRPEALVKTISEATGKSLIFLDSDTEIQLSIAGAIPRLWKVGDTQIDNRNSSVLIEINGDRTLGGYQLLKYPPNAAPRYDFVTMRVLHGVAGDESFRQALRRERENKPGLVNRKRVYLMGSVAWAMATLIYPEDQQPFVPLTSEVIEYFAGKVARAPRDVLNPNLSFIRDRDLRLKAESELQAVRSAFTAQQLADGVEAARAAASEFEWQGKQLWFARFGHLGRLLSYVRLQAEK